MQKLIISKQFLGVKPCEIEFDRFLLLIGEQASGKSTVAKLIYFFQSLLKKDIVVLCNDKTLKEDLKLKIEVEAANLFQRVFGGLSIMRSPIDLTFYYNLDRTIYIKIYSNSKGDLQCNLAPFLISQSFLEQRQVLFNEIDADKQSAFLSIINLWANNKQDRVNALIHTEFGTVKRRDLFVIAGRSNTVAYSEWFEKHFFAHIINTINDKRKLLQPCLDDILMVNFLERVIEIKNQVKALNAINEFTRLSQKNKPILDNVKEGGLIYENGDKSNSNETPSILDKKSIRILKGEYLINGDNEELSIKDSNNKPITIPFQQTSSGQQEVIRILQDLSLIITEKETSVFRVIEEPEAHLFPSAQKDIIDLLALMLNNNRDNQLIITTHSPYILACVNILLFADYVAKNSPTEVMPTVLNAVDKAFWLDSKIFSAYSLGHADEYCKNIKDPDSGLIDQNYLDLISEQLGLQYNDLYNLLIQHHA